MTPMDAWASAASHWPSKRDDATSPPPKRRSRTGHNRTKASVHAGSPAVGVKLRSKKTQRPIPIASPAAAAIRSPINSRVDRSLWRSEKRLRVSGRRAGAVAPCTTDPVADRCADTAPPRCPRARVAASGVRRRTDYLVSERLAWRDPSPLYKRLGSLPGGIGVDDWWGALSREHSQRDAHTRPQCRNRSA